MDCSKTSIIILAYQEPEKFKKMFETLLEHTHQKITPFEIIIIDNDCDPKIRDYLNSGELATTKFKMFNYKINLGTSKGFNVGAQESKGHYLCFFNSDYYMVDNWLESMIDCFEHQPNIGLCSCCTNCTGNIVERYGTITQLPNDYIEAECAIAQMFTTKEIWEEVGGFDENLYPISFEDLDFNERIKEKGYRVFVNRKCFGFHDYTPSKEEGRTKIKERNRTIFKKKWGDKFKWA